MSSDASKQTGVTGVMEPSRQREAIALVRRGGGTIGEADVGTRVLLQAWVRRRRDHGGVIFLDLRDRSGTVQVVVRPEDAPAAAAALDKARLEWVVEVEGTVARRSAETVNPKIPTGAFEVIAARGLVLSKCDPLPFSLEGAVEASEETRLRFRYLDLRRDELQRNLRLRHEVVMESLRYFDEHGFLHVETPILTRSTPEGARDYLVPSRVHRGSFFALPQSPQLFKQILQVAGCERYVQICRCFRDEDLRADRQPEFSQIDVEMSFVDRDQVMAVMEGLTQRLFPLAGVEVHPPFDRYTHADVMARYGVDKPDLRASLEMVDLTRELGGSGFRAFRQTAEEGGAILGLAVPGAAVASRREVDEWAEQARAQGVAGVLPLRRRDGALQFQVKDSLTAGELEAAGARLQLAEGDLALLVAAPRGRASAALGELRVPLAKKYGHWAEGHRLLWVTDFPLVEWSADRRSLHLRPSPVHPSPPRGPGAARQRSGGGALARLRHRAQRCRARGRLDPYPRLRAAGAGVPPARDLRSRSARAIRLPARRLPLRRTAARRDRGRARPAGDAAGGLLQHPRGDRVPQDRLGVGPDDAGAVAGRSRAALRARHPRSAADQGVEVGRQWPRSSAFV